MKTKQAFIPFFVFCGLLLSPLWAGEPKPTPTPAEKPKQWEPEQRPFEKPSSQEKLHVYLLLGQSNMVGMDRKEIESQSFNPRIGSYASFVVNNKWQNLWLQAIYPLSGGTKTAGMGPGISFAEEMLKSQPADVKIALVPLAVGGSGLSQWEKGAPYYKSVVSAIAAMKKEGYPIKGILWHQGETDALAEETANTYKDRLVQTFKNFRAEAGDENLSIVVGQIGIFVDRCKFLKTVNGALAEMPAALPNVGYATSEGLKCLGDRLHFTGDAQIEFGKRYAAVMLELQKKSEH